MGQEALQVGTAVAQFADDDIRGVQKGTCQVQSGAILFRTDGQTPEAGSAFIGEVNSVWEFGGEDLNGFRAIRQGATDGVLFCDFED